MLMLNHRAALDAGRAICLHIWRYWPGASERGCYLFFRGSRRRRPVGVDSFIAQGLGLTSLLEALPP